MKRSACLIFNPVAGKRNPDQDLCKIQALLEPEFNLDIWLTTKEVDAAQLTRKAIAQKASTIIVSGGDGTVSEAAGELIKTNIPLGVIPGGTANALALALEIPNTIEEACQTILEGETRTIDISRCNKKPMVLLAGVGFEAEVVEKANRDIKNQFGSLAYFLAGFQQLSEFETFEAKIEADEEIITVTAAAVTVANIAPPTSFLAHGGAEMVFDDGLLDLTIVAPQDQLSAIAASYQLIQSAFQRKSGEYEDIGYLQARRIKVTAHPPQKVVLDGEVTDTTPIEVECIPGGLTVFVPMSEKEKVLKKLEKFTEGELTVKPKR
ncbi:MULTISPECIES: YegS/Rv2252/BmrU family lipid kinase [unclassified Coleofasciculus]|uniref:YegS/Rv2252/BmrU family lipid kinase n=1 Tax=unclassified Coleofasciculus TaxID=2692782 RepID=UPI00187E8027|nr:MULTISPECIES: YegS/Rv2252/BmrU family lipid kinase [unclassified Coleofasciculus]MBE9127130.1 YegS/Rv2252/BmrU family lipid kinase [Coleofasciculus sp. LEGE 07081]MBE9149763.1 YegS/Rv2252/BmrU family lipid kinase [Coleofasciculus sp. LEGE 07092]